MRCYVILSILINVYKDMYMYPLFTDKRRTSYKVCLFFVVLSVTVSTVAYVCPFHGSQIFVDFVSFLSMIIY